MPVAVNADVEFLESLSAHADYGDIMRWLGGFTQPPKCTFLVHGEPEACQSRYDAAKQTVKACS